MKTNMDVKKITGVGILLALEIVFQIIGNFVAFPIGVSLNLALIPIAIGAILYGPLAGGLIGLVNGIVVLLAPSTLAIFMPYAPGATIITCLLKCTIAGIVSGLIYKLLAKKHEVLGTIIASLIVPLINTYLFAFSALTIMSEPIINLNGGDANYVKFLFLGVIGINFIFEFSITAILSPAIVRITRVIKKH